MKTKEDFLKEQINTNILSPLQEDGILKAMVNYAEQQVNLLLKPKKVFRASIKSQFAFQQEVWFLNGRHIMNGKIETIKGQQNYSYGDANIELEVYHTSGEMGCKFWVKEEDCFESRQALVDAIIGVKPINEVDKL